MTDASRPKGWSSPRLALGLVLGLGAALRLYSYLANPSLTVDDAMLTLNVATRSFAGLLHPLAMEQTAPPLFLWLLKAAVLIGGVHDPVVRLVPLIAGLILPYTTWRLARRVLTPGPAAVAAALAALSPILVEYSVTAKPYVLDAVISTLLLSLCLDILDAPDRGAGWGRLAGAGAMALLISTPAVFTLAGCLVALLAAPAVRGSAPARRWMVPVAVGWLAVFSVVYFSLLRFEAQASYMQAFWSDRYLTWRVWVAPARSWNVIKRLFAQSLFSFRALDEPTLVYWVAAVASAWGIADRKGRGILLVTVAPLGVMLVASAAHLYPIAPRLSLFAAPICFLLFAGALDLALTRWPSALARGIAWSATAVVLTVVGARAARTGFWAPGVRPLAAGFQRTATRGEPVYVFAGAIPAWLVYTTAWQDPDRERLRRVLSTQEADGAAFHNAAPRGHAVSGADGTNLSLSYRGHVELLGLAPGIQYREGLEFSGLAPDSGWSVREAERIRAASNPAIWIVMAHEYVGERGDLLGAVARAGGRQLSVWQDRGAALYHFEFAR